MNTIRRKNYYIIVINIIMTIISPLLSLYIAYNTYKVQGYELLYLLPIIFGLCFIVLLSRPLIMGNSIFLWTFTLFAFLRYLALPFFITIQNYFFIGYAYISPRPLSIKKGIILMLYEIILSSVFIRLLYKKFLCKPENSEQNEITINKFLPKSKFIYSVFIGFSIIILISNPDILKGISFFNNFNRFSSEDSSLLTSLNVQFVMLAKLLLYFIIVAKLHEKYIETKKTKYLLWTYIVSILNIGIFVGVNRKRILLNVVSSIFTVNYLYPKHKRKTTIIMFIIAIVIFLQLTSFRFYTNTDRNLFSNIAGTLQVYLSGPYNMAIAVETSELYKNEISILNILYDLGRPFYGIGQILKKFDLYISTEYFNGRLSMGGPLRSDQIMPITGQGMLHFGPILSPLYLILSIILGLFSDKKLKDASSLEEKYILCLISTMFGQAMGVNFIIITNIVTFNGVLFYIFYFLNSKITIKKHITYNKRMVDEKPVYK